MSRKAVRPKPEAAVKEPGLEELSLEEPALVAGGAEGEVQEVARSASGSSVSSRGRGGASKEGTPARGGAARKPRKPRY